MSENIFSRFSAAHLKRAAAIKERIEQLEKELTGFLRIPESMTVGGTMRRHRKMSVAAKLRWARLRGAKKG